MEVEKYTKLLECALFMEWLVFFLLIYISRAIKSSILMIYKIQTVLLSLCDRFGEFCNRVLLKILRLD